LVLKPDEIEFKNESQENKIRLKCIKDVLKNCHSDKLFWFSEHIRLSSDDKLFRIGDPVYIFEKDLREIILTEAICSRKYRVSRKHLVELELNLKKIIEERLNCYSQVWIPLLDSNDLSEEWGRAIETRNIGKICVTAEKKFDGKMTRVVF